MSRIPYSTTDYGVTTLANLTDVSAEGATDGQELRLESGVFTTKTPHAVYNATSKSVVVGSSMDVSAAVECIAAAGTPSTRSMAWIGADLGIYDTTNGWRKVSTESF